MDSIYGCTTEGAVALSAATAKTIIGAKAHANSGLDLLGFRIAFDGVTATAVPVLIEAMYCTWGANSPGTNSTSTTVRQGGGRVLTAGFTSGKTWTTEPTTLTLLPGEEILLTPNAGTLIYDYVLGRDYDAALAEGFAIRCTAPATVNVRAGLILKRN